MRLSGSNNLLDRAYSVSSQNLSHPQLGIDAVWSSVQTLTGDWKTAALALGAPFAFSRLSGVFRTAVSTARLSTVTEMTLSAEIGANVFARASWVPKWGRFAGLTLGMGAGLTACGSEGPDRTPDAGLQAPRAFEVQGAEYSVSPHVSNGTSQGFHAALNESGQMVVSWADVNSSDPIPSTLYLRVFPPSGNPGNVVEADHPELGLSLLPSVSITENGNILTAWTNSQGANTPSGIFARRFSSAGQAQGASFPIVPLENHMPVIMGAISLNPDGSFRVVSNENSTSCGVCARNYGANNIQTNVMTLSEANTSVLVSDMASSAQGDWAWAGLLAAGNGERQVRFRYFNAGSTSGVSTTFSIGNPGSSTKVQVAILPNDNSLLLWQSNQGLRGMVLSPDGRPVSAQITLNSIPLDSSFSATSDETGAFVVAWEEAGQIHASLLASDGRIISNNQIISESGSNNREVVVTANERGRVSFVWRHAQQNPAGYALQARNYQIRY